MKKVFLIVTCFLSALSGRAQTNCTLTAPSISGLTTATCATSSNFTLTANGAGSNFAWFSNSVGGNALSTNSVFITPTFTNSGATYYAGTYSTTSTSSISLPAAGNPSYSYDSKGMWFVAPSNFIITGLRVPLDAGGTSNSTITVIKFTSSPPPYTIVPSSSYTTIFTDPSITHTNIVSVNIPVNNGDVIGVIGARSSTVSYGPSGQFTASLGTNTLTLTRLVHASSHIDSEPNGILPRMEVYTSFGCMSSLTPVTVSVPPIPQVTISAPSGSICANTQYTLTAGGVSSYTWIGGPQSSSYVINPSTQTTYSVLGSSSVTCNSSAAITISVNSGVPNLAVTRSNSMICSGNSVSISAGGATTYTLSGPTSTIGNNVSFIPNSTTNYTILGQNSCGTSSVVTSITVNSTPTILTAASSSVICNGDPTILTASGAASYTWNPGGLIGSSVSLNPSSSSAFVVTGASAEGCQANATRVILVNPNPPLNAVASKTLVCIGGASTLIATGASTYSWSTNAQTANTLVNPLQTTVYSVTGTYTNTGCFSQKTITVNVFTPTLSLSSNTAVCYGSLVTLTANAGPGSAYTWSVINSPFSVVTLTALVTSTYIVSAITPSNGVNCPSSNTVVLIVNPLPTLSALSNTTSICRGETAIISASGAITYTWNTNATTTIIQVSPSSSAFYSVQGTDLNGCVNSASVQVTVNACTGINELGSFENKVLIFPNPNSGSFSITSNSDLHLNLINELGQLLRLVHLTEANHYKVDISDLATGIYFIVGEKNGEQISHKLIVTK